jgi:hypothetical protein
MAWSKSWSACRGARNKGVRREPAAASGSDQLLLSSAFSICYEVESTSLNGAVPFFTYLGLAALRATIDSGPLCITGHAASLKAAVAHQLFFRYFVAATNLEAHNL